MDYRSMCKLVSDAQTMYHRLLIISGQSGTGKTELIRSLASSFNTQVTNVNLQLSKKLIEVEKSRRSFCVEQLFYKIIENDNMNFLDNIEILFDSQLRINPLRLLKDASRNKTIITTWNGEIQGNDLTYAMPFHHEYTRCNVKDLIVISIQDMHIT